MRLLLILILILTASAWAAPLRVTRDGDTVRVTPAPEWARARIEGTRLVWDVAWKGAVDATDVSVSRPQPGVVRLTCPVPRDRTASIARSRHSLRLSLGLRGPLSQGKRVTQDFVDADVIYVIKVLAKASGRNVYIGPAVEGELNVNLRCAPPEAALALILSGLDGIEYKVLSNGSGGQTFVIAPPEKLATIPDDIFERGPGCSGPCCFPTDPLRQEIILDRAPAAEVMEFLQSQYKNVQFTAHPTMNGFYVYGSRKDVVQLKAEVPNLDRVPEPPPPPVSREFAIRYPDPDEVKRLIATLVPDCDYALEGRTLTVTGPPAAVDQVVELLAEFNDWPDGSVRIDCKLVEFERGYRRQLPSAPTFVMPREAISGFVSGAFPIKVLAAPVLVARFGQQPVLLIGDRPQIGLRLTVTPQRVGDNRLKLHLRSDLLDRTTESDVELEDGETFVWTDVIRAEDIDAIRRRPDLAQLPILSSLFRSAPSGLSLMLTVHLRP